MKEPGRWQTVLGRTIAEGAESEGLQVLHILATSPATAKFISTKLAVRFVSDTPSPKLVDRMAKAFVMSGGDIKTVLRTMFDSPEFWSSEVYRAKMKTPEEFVVSAVRASGADVKNAIPLTQSLDRLGMPLYGMQTPNGYSWMAEPWVNAGDLVSRMNFALLHSAATASAVSIQTNWTGLLGGAKPAIQPAGFDEGFDWYNYRCFDQGIEAGVGAAGATGERPDEGDCACPVAGSDPCSCRRLKIFPFARNDFEPMAQVLNPAALNRPVRPPLDHEAATMAGLLLGSPEFQRR